MESAAFMRMSVTVRVCYDCPFFGDEFGLCQSVVSDGEPDGKPLPSFSWMGPPTWCPLRIGLVTVSAAEGMPGPGKSR